MLGLCSGLGAQRLTVYMYVCAWQVYADSVLPRGSALLTVSLARLTLVNSAVNTMTRGHWLKCGASPVAGVQAGARRT